MRAAATAEAPRRPEDIGVKPGQPIARRVRLVARSVDARVSAFSCRLDDSARWWRSAAAASDPCCVRCCRLCHSVKVSLESRTAFGRLAEANRMLNYLETTGLLDAPAWRALVDEWAKAIASASDGINGADDDVVTDDRQALE